MLGHTRMQKKKRAWESVKTVALVGNYLPRRCGIATFTSDLTESIATVAPDTDVWAVAMNNRPEGYRYPPRVWFEINQNRLGEYRLAADFINMSNVDVCCLQHEFGIYGGKAGSYIVEFMRRLRMPIVTTLHTVLKEPEKHYYDGLLQVADASDRLVVMAERAYDFLINIYKIPKSKIAMIHHGIPDVPFVDPNFYKDQFGVEGKKVILTFGLLSPNKGIENMIDALPLIIEQYPDAFYIVLGATHPGIMAHSGEDYRLGLKRKARELGVENHIEFINKFVELDELVEYLGAADIYVTPYHNETQITSGTLAYALGTGKATVSTPYWYAEEMLADGRGRIVPFKDHHALAEAVIELLNNETERHATRKRAYQYTRQMCWRDVAAQYLNLFQTVRDERNRHPKPAVPSRQRGKLPELTEIKLDHLLALTDDTGIFQHAKTTIPDRNFGYTTEDNARALITVLLAQDHLHYTAGAKLDILIGRFLSFIEHAYNEETGRFRNVMGFDRQWKKNVTPSEEAHGKALWALGEAVARCHMRGHMTFAANLFQRALPVCETLRYLHGLAYSLIGIHAYLRRFSGDSHARRVRENLANKLFDQFRNHEYNNWPWPADKLTYDNARIPHALLLSGRWMFNNEMIQSALRSLEWLADVQSTDKEQFAPVGTDGWFPQGGQKARFDQKPIEACAAIDAYLEAFRVTSDREWLDRADRCLNWFLGDNDLRIPLYDHTTGGCSDGLMPQGLNENQGVESTLSWLLSLMSLYEFRLDVETPGNAVTVQQPQATDAATRNSTPPPEKKTTTITALDEP